MPIGLMTGPKFVALSTSPTRKLRQYKRPRSRDIIYKLFFAVTVITLAMRPLLRPVRYTWSLRPNRLLRMQSTGSLKWNPDQYTKFLTERTQPSRDLLSRVPLLSPKRIIDLGCGTGNSTDVVAQRYTDSNISGIDSSPDMIAKAQSAYPQVSFEVADLQSLRTDGQVDLLFSNAAFQWLPSSRRIEIITRLVRDHISPDGGVLAFQVPFNMSEPSHVAMQETAIAPGTLWEETLKHANPKRDEFPAPSELYEGLKPLCSEVQIWRTTYYHIMENHEAIVEWVKSTGLRPYIDPLSAEERDGFLRHYLDIIRRAYPAQQDGKVFLPYPRLFVVAQKAIV